MYHTEPPTDKTIREWYMNSSRVAACALRNEQAVRAFGPERPVRLAQPAHNNNDDDDGDGDGGDDDDNNNKNNSSGH